MRIVSFLVVLLLLHLSGCAGTSTTRLEANSIAHLPGKQLHIVREKPDPFLPMSYSKGMFGVIGVAAAVEEGKKIIRETSLQDPSHGLEDNLTDYVIEKYSLSGRGQVLDFVSEGKPGDLASWSRKNNIQGVALDVETRGWQYTFDGFNYSDYKIIYVGKLTLIDLQSGKLLSSHTCAKGTKTLQNGKVYREEDLLANNAELLKQLFGTLAEACLQEFKVKAL